MPGYSFRVGRLRPSDQARFGKAAKSCSIIFRALAALIGALSTTAFAAPKVTVKLEGEIVPECAISAFGADYSTSTIVAAMKLGDVTRATEESFDFTVNCNAPFEYRIDAEHGALKHVAAGVAPGGFTTSVPYDLSVRIPTEAGVIQDNCPKGSLEAAKPSCRFSNSGSAIALSSPGRLTVNLQPDVAVPLAGGYRDRITMTVGVQQ